MFANIAVVAQPGPELQEIRNHLRNPLRYVVREFLSLEDVNQGLNQYPFDVLVTRLNVFDAPHVNMLLRIRMRFPKAGLITISPEIHPSARYQIKEITGHKLLHEPMEIQDLPKVIERLLTGDAGATRLHPRVRRQDECELVDVEHNQRFRARFVDFGQMGARLQVAPRTPLKKNTRFQLHYRSTTEPSRIHRIESNVVWAEMNSGFGTIVSGPQQLIGLRFIAAL